MARPVKPGPIVVPNACEVALIWDVAGQRCTNILHGAWSQVGPVNPNLPETLFQGFKTQFMSSAFNAQVAVGTSFVGVGFRDIRFANQPQYLSNGAAVQGADATGPLPASTSVVVTLLSELAGRAFRGRVYLPGLGIFAALDARHHTATCGTAAKAFVDGIDQVMTTNSCALGIAQRELLAGEDVHGNPLPARAAALVDVVSTKIASARFDVQRRRLGR